MSHERTVETLHQPAPIEPVKLIYSVEQLLGSHKHTQKNLQAHKSANLDVLTQSGYDRFRVFHDLHHLYDAELISGSVFTTGKGIYNAWDELRNKHVSEMAMTNPKLNYSGEGDPTGYLWGLVEKAGGFNSKIYPVVQRILSEAGTRTLKDPNAQSLLEAQSVYEETLLDSLVPFWREATIPEEVEEQPLGLTVEPRTIDEAIEIVERTFDDTRENLDYYEGKSVGHNTEFGLTYRMLSKDGYFASLFTPEQMMEAKKYIDKWFDLQHKISTTVIGEYTSEPIGDKDPFEITDKWSEQAQDNIADKLRRMRLADPRCAQHFRDQYDYEGGLKDHLEGLKQGSALKEPQDKEEVKDLVRVCHEWTKINLDTFQAHRWLGWKGGYRRFYDLLGQDGVVSHVLPTKLVAQGKALYQRINVLKSGSLSESLKRTWGLDMKDQDPEKFIQSIEDSKASYTPKCFPHVRTRALGIMFDNPEVAEHFTEQSLYEVKVLRYLAG